MNVEPDAHSSAKNRARTVLADHPIRFPKRRSSPTACWVMTERPGAIGCDLRGAAAHAQLRSTAHGRSGVHRIGTAHPQAFFLPQSTPWTRRGTPWRHGWPCGNIAFFERAGSVYKTVPVLAPWVDQTRRRRHFRARRGRGSKARALPLGGQCRTDGIENGSTKARATCRRQQKPFGELRRFAGDCARDLYLISSRIGIFEHGLRHPCRAGIAAQVEGPAQRRIYTAAGRRPSGRLKSTKGRPGRAACVSARR